SLGSSLDLVETFDDGRRNPLPRNLRRVLQRAKGQIDGHLLQALSHAGNIEIWSKQVKKLYDYSAPTRLVVASSHSPFVERAPIAGAVGTLRHRQPSSGRAGRKVEVTPFALESATVSAMRLPPHDGQSPRPLHDQA